MAYDSSKYKPICIGATGPTGPTGGDGTAVDVGIWHSGHNFAQGDRCYHTKTGYGQCVYRSLSAHTSAAASEPEVGGSWATYWEMFASGGADGYGLGDVTGDTSSTTGNLAGFSDTSGKAIEDIGTPKAVVDAVLSAETASTTATDGDVDSVVVKESGGWKLKTLDNVSQRYIPVTITAAAWQASTTDGCTAAANAELATNKFNLKSLAFVHTAKKYACFKMKMPLAYSGSTLLAYFEWHTTGTSTSGVRWGIQAGCIGNDEPLDLDISGSAVEVTDSATGAANRNLISPVTAAITPAGVSPAAGETLELRVYRDPTHGDDVLDATVYLDDVTVLIPVNKHSEA